MFFRLGLPLLLSHLLEVFKIEQFLGVTAAISASLLSSCYTPNIPLAQIALIIDSPFFILITHYIVSANIIEEHMLSR